MVLVSPSSGMLAVTYAIAVISVFAAFGLLVVGDSFALDSVTGAVSWGGYRCSLRGDLRCFGSDVDKQTLFMMLENTRDEPTYITRVRLGTCDPISAAERFEVGQSKSIAAEACFAPRNYRGPIPVEIYTQGVFSGLTRISHGKVYLS